jgi:hypothetical protein
MKRPISLEEKWRAAETDLSLSVAIPYDLVLPSGFHVHARVLVRCFGANVGMLIVSSFANVSAALTELVEQGYGFCVMDDPRMDEEYDRQTVIDVLSDWGWSGAEEERPAWLLSSS